MRPSRISKVGFWLLTFRYEKELPVIASKGVRKAGREESGGSVGLTPRQLFRYILVAIAGSYNQRCSESVQTRGTPCPLC